MSALGWLAWLALCLAAGFVGSWIGQRLTRPKGWPYY